MSGTRIFEACAKCGRSPGKYALRISRLFLFFIPGNDVPACFSGAACCTIAGLQLSSSVKLKTFPLLAVDQEPSVAVADDRYGVARVVAVEGDRIWLEPLPSGGCGACASASSCSAKGLGTLASRLESKRFQIAASGLAVGDEVVVSFGEDSPVGMAALAYAIPLLSSLVLAVTVDLYIGRDTLTMLAAVAGLAIGFGIARLGVGRLLAQGKLQPRLVRRVDAASSLLERQSPHA